MDVDMILSDTEVAVSGRHASHARHLLRKVRPFVEDDTQVFSLVKSALADINSARWVQAYNDVNTALIIDERSSFSVAM